VNVLGRLQAFPRLGHRGIVDGTLERLVLRTPYMIVYRIDVGGEDELVVLRVYHAAQHRSPGGD
jgi:toxin ParE1/3/4